MNKKQKDPRHFPIDVNYVKFINKYTKTGTDEEHERLVNKFYGYDKKERTIIKILEILGIMGYSLSIGLFVFYNSTTDYSVYGPYKIRFIPIIFVITNLVFFGYYKLISFLYKQIVS